MKVKQNIAALMTGILFGFGLGVAQMIDPNKIQNFLDIAGTWDASLMLVLGAALGVSFFAIRTILKQQSPRFAACFSLPSKPNVDRSLLIGAALFGIGWGMAGYCPGPGFAALALSSWEPVIFLLTMTVGFILHRFIVRP